MKHSILAAAVVALAATFQPALAQSAKPADKAVQAQPPALNPAEFDKQLAQMRDYMTQMQAQMDKIAKTQDPQERQRLLQDHWTSMQAPGQRRVCGPGPSGAGWAREWPGTMALHDEAPDDGQPDARLPSGSGFQSRSASDGSGR